ncbi:hypothetical protein RRG08_022109 [Elysia crispata]|uniref:G-protein coupled receptors family 1 profile domain-containing protein n=1 Tax=Elysia crispata TaxID=231223 RepID=A0AAE0Y096_9GAST|nr:hypothetical protein RRG08_022109 [Elysia crispata]
MGDVFDSNTNKTFFTTFSDFGPKFEGQTALEIVLLSVIFICGLTGNILVILSTAMFKHMRSTSNLLLCYQSVADLCLAIFPIPITMTRITSHWTLGDVTCRIYMYLFFITGCLTLLCMCSLAIDRYLSICRPQTYNFLKIHPYWSAVLLLCISVFLNYNNLLDWRELTARSLGRNVTFCGREWVKEPKSTLSNLLFTIMFFFSPLCIVFLMHAVVWNHVRQSARRIANVRTSLGTEGTSRGSVQASVPSTTRAAQTKLLQMLIMSVILFVLMFTPFVVVDFIIMYGGGFGDSNHRAWMFTTILALANCFVNPILIYLFNVKYRACFKAVLHFRYKPPNRSLETETVISASVRQ